MKATAGALAVLLSLLIAGPFDPRPGAQGVDGFRLELKLENEHVRVIENIYEPGGESPRHTHDWPRVVYVLEGGTLELEGPGDRIDRAQVEAGQTIWRPAETHVVRNVGRSRVRVVEVEVKVAAGDLRGAMRRAN